MLAPVTEVHPGEESLLQLNVEGARRFAGFVAELEALTQVVVGYRPCGTLMVARDVDDNAVLDDLFAFQRGLGLEVERLHGSGVRALEPGLSPRTRGGILAPDDHQVDPTALLMALRTACIVTGVEFVDDRVAGISSSQGRATGVVLQKGGSFDAGAILIAAGCYSGAIDGLPPNVLPPVRPVKGQLLHLAGPPSYPVADHNIRGVDVYVVPRANGRVVVGATVEEVGFDTEITTGAVFELLRAAYELLPEISELRFVRAAAGLRPGTPDNAPVIGLSSMEGLHIATGHFRNGVLLAAVTGDLVAELLDTGRTPPELRAFSPRRFEPEVAA